MIRIGKIAKIVPLLAILGVGAYSLVARPVESEEVKRTKDQIKYVDKQIGYFIDSREQAYKDASGYNDINSVESSEEERENRGWAEHCERVIGSLVAEKDSLENVLAKLE